MEHEGAEESPTHCTAAEGEQSQDSEDLIDWDTYADMPVLLPPSFELSSYPELPTYLDFPPTLPLLPPPIIPATSAPPPLHPGSPYAHHQSTICVVGSPRVCLSPSALWLGDPLSPPPASESWTPPWPSDPAAPPRLLALSSPPSAHQLHRAPSSLRLRLGWSLSCHCLRTPLLSLRLVAPPHRLRWAPPSLQLHLDPQSLRLRRRPPDLCLQSGTDRRRPWRCRELQRPWWSKGLRRPWRCRELRRPWQMVFRGRGLVPRPGHSSRNPSTPPPPQTFHGVARGYQEPSGARQTGQYMTRQENPPGPDKQDRTSHRNQKPSWAGLEAEASSGHDMTSGALTGSLSNRFHIYDRGTGGWNGLRGHKKRSRLPQTSLHGQDKTRFLKCSCGHNKTNTALLALTCGLDPRG